ncbi:MAG TPA: acyl-CoA dehydrogenase family protein [Mycobacteriales bacterium]|jgi:acyl-CoA dehydrogenase
MARVVPEPVQEDARAAADLARSVVAGGASLASVGLLDESLPWAVRVEVAREAGRGSCASGLAAFGAEPVLAAAVLCGAGEAAAETGMAYARERVVFGRPLARMPVQRHAFATVAAQVEAATALVRRVAAFRDGFLPVAAVEEAAVLPYALDAAWAAVEAALQVHGGYGYTDEYPVSRMWTEVAAARVTHGARPPMSGA